jgi:nucleoside 2-deoxyribosyltransferase
MKVYFAAPIRGKYEYDGSVLSRKIIKHLQSKHLVLTEHLANEEIIGRGELNLKDKEIHDRDMNWIKEADVIIAEVSNPSLGVGYELGRAVEMGKRILCLYRQQNRPLSAMIRGADGTEIADYRTDDEAIKIVDEFIENL